MKQQWKNSRKGLGGSKKTTKLSQNNKQRNPVDIKDDLPTGMTNTISGDHRSDVLLRERHHLPY